MTESDVYAKWSVDQGWHRKILRRHQGIASCLAFVMAKDQAENLSLDWRVGP